MTDILISHENDISLLVDVSNEPKLLSIEEPVVINTVDEPIYLNTVEEVTAILHTGITGPAGPAGPGGGEDEVAQSKRTDFITDNLLYRGEALPGTLESVAGWRVRKIVIGDDNDVTETWANGSGDYIHIWDDRETYPYS